MKYFAHYCSADSDPKIVQLFEEHGYNGTGIYWRLCAIVAGMKNSSGDTPEYLCLPRALTHHHRCSIADVNKVVRTLTQLGLIESREEGGKVYIKIPKLNKYTDENTKRKERERKPKRPDNVRPEENRTEENRKEEKDLRSAPSAPPLGGEPSAQDVNPEEREQILKTLKSVADQIGKAEERKAVPKAPGNEKPQEPCKAGEGVDPELKYELELTREDIIRKGFDPGRAGQIIRLIEDYHSGRMEAFDLSRHLDAVVNTFEKVSLYEVEGVISRRGQ